MLIDLKAVRVWYCPDPINMRAGIDSLLDVVAFRMREDPSSGHLFIFSNKKADKLKVLYWDGRGVCLWYRRLSSGTHDLPRAGKGRRKVQLTERQLREILSLPPKLSRAG